jgi:alpha-N-arabinofuranosidase
MRTLKLILSGWQSVALVVFFMLFFNMEVSGKVAGLVATR